MRKDIAVNTKTGELVLKDQGKSPLCAFEWNAEDDLYLYGQIKIQEYIDINLLYNTGIRVQIPYTPVYKNIKISILRDFETYTTPELNQINGGIWFDLKCALYNDTIITPKASELVLIDDVQYKINIKDNQAFVWASEESDLINIEANDQNKVLLLKCVPSNHYRYPTSGVGLVRYLHSNVHQTDLASRLYSEFKEDKVIVNNAAFNTDIGHLDLDLDYSEANANV